MSLRRLVVPVLVALACVGLVALPAWAAGKPAAHPHHSKKRESDAPLGIAQLKVGGAAGPLVVKVDAGTMATVRMTVNGHRVRHPFEAFGRSTQIIELLASDGLHAGSNKLHIRATQEGASRSVDRQVKIPGWALAADAGEDTGAVVDDAVKLGTAVGAGAARATDYRWKVLDRPRGAKVELTDADSSEPSIEADKPGQYVVQLVADPDAPGVPDALDQVTVTETPDDPPLGVPLNTYVGAAQIQIGDERYGGFSRLNYAVLERGSRQVVASGGLEADEAGVSKLIDLANDYSQPGKAMAYMMIVNGAIGIPSTQIDRFAGFLKKIGVAVPAPEEMEGIKQGQSFSLIGIPGAEEGAATTRIASLAPGSSNGITGYLSKNQATDGNGAPLYDYLSPEQPEFDTRAPGAGAGANRMSIDGRTFEASLPAGATAGFHIVVLDSISLHELSNHVYPTNGLAEGDRATQKKSAEEIAKAIDQPGGPTVFVQTVGRPTGAGPEWEGIVKDMSRLKANPVNVYGLNGSNEFALVSRLGAKSPPAESSSDYDHGPYPAPSLPAARLVGTLVRSRTSTFVPNVYSTPTPKNPQGSVNLQLIKVAYQPQRSWPDLWPAGSSAARIKEANDAEQFLCRAIELCAQPGTKLHEFFWRKYNLDWSVQYTTLANAKWRGGLGFTEPVFDEVQAELGTEVRAVALVHTWLRQLQEPLTNSGGSSYVNLQRIGKEIWQGVQAPPNDNSTSFALGLIGKVAALGGFAKPPVSSAAAGISAAFGLASYLSNNSGQPILGSEITARSETLGEELYERIASARKTTNDLGKLIVSDYGKLIDSKNHILGDWELPSPDEAAPNLLNASKQWFYEALVPTAYPYLVQAVGVTNARDMNCKINPGTQAWPRQSNEAQMGATVGYDANGNPIPGVFFFVSGIGGGGAPPEDLAKKIFGPPGTGVGTPAGIEKRAFFNTRVFGGRIVHAVNNTSYCGLGWLPSKY